MTIRRYSITAILASSVALAGCDTGDQLKQQRDLEFKNEYASLTALQDLLAKSEIPRKDGVEVFISKGILDQGLTGLAGSEFPSPNVDGATVRIEEIKTDFRIGFPRIEIKAVARKAGIQVTLRLAARLETEIVDGNPATLRAKVHIDSIVPDISWGMFDFRIGGFVRDLAQLKISELANGSNAIGRIDLPLGRDFDLHLAAKSTPVPLGIANVNIGTPDIGTRLKARIAYIVFLPDGIHLFGFAGD